MFVFCLLNFVLLLYTDVLSYCYTKFQIFFKIPSFVLIIVYYNILLFLQILSLKIEIFFQFSLKPFSIIIYSGTFQFLHLIP